MNFQLLFMKRGLFQFTIPDLLKASKDKNQPLQRQRRILSLKGNFDSIFNTCELN